MVTNSQTRLSRIVPDVVTRLKKCRPSILLHEDQQEFSRYNRSHENYDAFTFLAFAQPIPAYIGLIGSLATVFVLTTATWWKNQGGLFQKVALAYAAVSIPARV